MTAPDVSPATPEQLARRAQAGCSRSFEELVRQFQTPLLHFLRRHTRHHADAEDLLQETFLRSHQSLERYDPRRRFGAWLFTIAYRLAVSHHRSRSLRRTVPLQITGSDTESPDAIAGGREERQRLWGLARHALNADQFTALWLHYAHEMPVREIATVMSRTVPGVKILLFRGRRILKRRLPSHGFNSPGVSGAEVQHESI